MPFSLPVARVLMLLFWRKKLRKQIVTALFLAVLVTASADAQTTNFFRLAENGTPQQVQAAINKGADVKARDNDGWTALMDAAAKNPDSAVIGTLLKAGSEIEARDEHGWTALADAAASNRNPAVIRTLLRAGAKIDAQDAHGWTALTDAAGWN